MTSPDPMAAWAADLAKSVGPQATTRIIRTSTRAAQKGAEAGAARRIGADMAMSGFKGGKKKLSVSASPIDARSAALDFRPPGLWVLANTGRKESGPIFPRRGPKRGAPGRTTTPGRAILTPDGPRARSSYGPQDRQPRALDTAVDVAGRRGRVQMRKSFHKEVKRSLGGPNTYKYRFA